jgi:hypothetical protein
VCIYILLLPSFDAPLFVLCIFTEFICLVMPVLDFVPDSIYYKYMVIISHNGVGAFVLKDKKLSTLITC